jgi:hypothetical protein
MPIVILFASISVCNGYDLFISNIGGSPTFMSWENDYASNRCTWRKERARSRLKLNCVVPS